MSLTNLTNIRQAEGIMDMLEDLRGAIQRRINLSRYEEATKPVEINNNRMLRLCLLAGLSRSERRDAAAVEAVKLSGSGNRIFDTVFSLHGLTPLYSALLKLRYKELPIDWEGGASRSKVINHEIMLGRELLSNETRLDEWLFTSITAARGGSGGIPELKLAIGSYEGDIPALLNMNGASIPNTQILIAGTTGQGKSNLLAVLINELRALSIDSAYPVNFLLFDYKGEFSDPANAAWLRHFEVDGSAILNPVNAPLPFTPFKDFTGRAQNEINLYSTELANALCAIDRAAISANMSNRLSEAIIAAYRATENKPVTFQNILDAYNRLLPEKEREKTDSVKSVLAQIIRTNLFAERDSVNLINDSFVVNLGGFAKDGPIAKAIVYFIISKLNTLYESLPKQAADEHGVELRHFTIIDEAHYMLGFENKPLANLIAVGRNKGMNIILATQSMDSYKTEHFDFFANAQYPLLMKQQTMADGVLKDLFGVSGKDFQELKAAIGGLGKGELIIKDATAVALGLGKRWKKIVVRHLI